jgi:hypothetical protein
MSELDKFLLRDNQALRKAGCNLAEAGMHVVDEFDGVHRLSLAISEWAKVIANEGGRGKESEVE